MRRPQFDTTGPGVALRKRGAGYGPQPDGRVSTYDRRITCRIRPRSNLIDYRVDNALTRERANFMDVGHYRAIIARRMEQGIAESIKSGDKAKIEF